MTLEIQELYQKEGYNPMGGCLPLLIQFPIIIALYNIVMNPLKYIVRLEADVIDRLANVASSVTGKTYDVARNINLLSDVENLDYSHFAGVEGFTREIYEDLPNLQMFGGAINLGETPTLALNWLLLVPLLTFAAYFFSMKMTRKLTYQPMADDKATGCSNKMMEWMMPLFSVYIAFVVPAAIGVYWIFKSLLGVIKQVIIRYAMPIPTFTEEDYKAAEKEVGTAKLEKNAIRTKSGKVVRSLHHIDDEDFADTAEAGRKRREALEAQAAQEAAQTAERNKSRALGEASVKKDDRSEKNKAKKAEKEQSANDAADTNENNDQKDGE